MLEEIEACTTECKVAKLEKKRKEDHEAYMKKLEEEDVDTWIEMLEHGEDGNGEALAFTSSPCF